MHIVCAKLQSVGLDLLAAVSIVKAFKQFLTELRNDEDNYSKLYDKVLDICRKQEIEIPKYVKQRKVSSRVDRNNTQYVVSEKKIEMEYFVYYIVLVDLLNGSEEIFNQETLLLISAIGRLFNTV